VQLVPALVSNADICHAPIDPVGLPEMIQVFAGEHSMPCLLTCHMREKGKAGQPNWLFVSRSLARFYDSDRVVLNGIDPHDFIFSETKEDYLLFISAMHKAMEKGLDLALSLARSKGFRLIIAGTGINYETIRQVSDLCAKVGAEYVGDVRGTRKAELIAGARALLFPSRLNEGCPLVILEAMMSGTPVISSRNGGTVEIVTEETGILCTRDGEWSAAIDRIDQISPARCRAIAMEKYHYRRMAQDYLGEYWREVERFSG
jgi:glycosyltransferase involved in cell wall biosynthesis